MSIRPRLLAEGSAQLRERFAALNRVDFPDPRCFNARRAVTMKVRLVINPFAVCVLFAALNFASAQTWQTTGASNHLWRSLACSADGTKLAAVVTRYPFIYASTNSGMTWFLSGAPSNNWTWVASSADGTKLVATVALIYNPAGGGIRAGPIFRSTDSGATWSETTAPTNQWSCVASSADGSTLIACAAYASASTAPGAIFISRDSGATGTATGASTNFWNTVVCSADGTRIVAAGSRGFTTPDNRGLFMSLDSGITWTSNFALLNADWESVSISADGSTVIASRSYGAPNPAAVFVSTNWGNTWTSNALPIVGRGYVAASAEGTTLMASKGFLYISKDFGVTWTRSFGQTYGWGAACVTSSADASKLFVALGADDFGQPSSIFTRFVPSRPRLRLAPSGADLELSWLVPSTNFVVQQASALGQTDWTTITNVPALSITNLRNQIFLPSEDPSAFYRLVTP